MLSYLTWIYLCLILSLLLTVSADSVQDLMDGCLDGFFGYKCLNRCNCADRRPCNKETGACANGCRPGFWGPSCLLENKCYYNDQKKLYRGSLSQTINFRTCQRWDRKVPHHHQYKEKDFIDGAYPKNYCRVTPDFTAPWCYTDDPETRWENCSVENCQCPPRRFGQNCMYDCHCLNPEESCNSATGSCVSGCAWGWGGHDCQLPVPCDANRYGWECTQTCMCVNPRHCDRFTGPNKSCTCKPGFFNPPICEPVNAPTIISFDNQKVNPGEPSRFNCTIAAYPVPSENDIQLKGPGGRRISIITSSLNKDSNVFARTTTFEVSVVRPSEKYTCYFKTIAGTAELTMVAKVYEHPRMSAPPIVASRNERQIRVEWQKWDRKNGDTGDGPVTAYKIYFKNEGGNTYTEAGKVLPSSCRGVCHFVLDKLSPSVNYTIYITAIRDGEKGEGPPGEVIVASTTCGKPKNPPIIENISSALLANSSYPKTQIVVKWKDPPRNTINCQSIKRYILYFSSEASNIEGKDMEPIDIPGGNTHSVTVPNLKPFTQYCAVIVLENNAQLRSQQSTRECIVTQQTAPGKPEKLKHEVLGNSSVLLTWQPPQENYGPITKYHVDYWGVEKNFQTVEVPTSNKDKIEYVLTDLLSYTFYQVRIRAENSAGVSEYSNAVNFTTEDGIPGLVEGFKNTSKTTSSITLKWQPPQHQNGLLLSFMVTCKPMHSRQNIILPHHMNPEPVVIPGNVFELLVRSLMPATSYNCSIYATTRKGSGDSTSIVVWTKPEAPRLRESVKILMYTENTATLKLFENSDLTISFFRIIVERKDNRRNKRHVPQYISNAKHSFMTALHEKSNVYITAELEQHEFRGTFVVGDNQTYKGYFNGPLQQNKEYIIWLGAYSNIDGIEQHTFSKADSNGIVKSLTASEEPASSVPIIIGVIIVFLLLVAIFAVLLLLWRKKHTADEREKAEIPFFGSTHYPDPDTSAPPSPIGRITLPIIDTFDQDPLIDLPKKAPMLDTEPMYCNADDIIAPIKVEDLWDYIRSAKQNDLEGLKKEFKLLPAGITSTCEVARKNENKLKNRYGNIIAYDHTRVVLDIDGDNIHDDYINANYIDGYNKQRVYIAAQGPSQPTLNDIWRMVWKENSKTIIMLTNSTESGKKKCDQYWPDIGSEQYGNIVVQLLNIDVLPDFTIRTFLISKGGQSKYVKQFHYTTWPDHGVPRFGHSLLLFRQKIRMYDNLDNGTVVIHCSAGVGRTGTYIAVDTQLEKAKSEGIIDVYNFVHQMRTQRVNMVQTLEQYVFVYDCLLEALICGDTTVSTKTFPEVYIDLCQFDADISKTKLEEQFEILKLLSTTIERDESTTALTPENIFKNRCKNIIPANRCRPYLMTSCDGSNDYINAVFLNSYCKKDQLLVTQMPLPNTVTDFWRLIYDHKSYCLVMLNEVEKNDDTCEQYWTEDPGGVFYGPFQVETTSEIKSNPIVTVRDFTLTNTQVPGDTPRQIRQFHFHRWQEGSATPSSHRALLELVDLADDWQKLHEGPITVHCMNGASRSGLFCAALTILERVKKDKEVDVFQAVKQLRLNRTQLIDNMKTVKGGNCQKDQEQRGVVWCPHTQPEETGGDD
ncbi:receptor-type tyrosine-protein phosphatase mu-like [Physella acuta]|uniref:receptor-type tyrosine-protein phosphatase mu-like n=1 Tax=Physella acuta TaxID=109671 RepID=UPI0027DB677C|nr:receptor-type tyrosine-protein phosphatase mu-like [Physella acuta]